MVENLYKKLLENIQFSCLNPSLPCSHILTFSVLFCKKKSPDIVFCATKMKGVEVTYKMNVTQVYFFGIHNDVTQPKETKRSESVIVNSLQEKYRIFFYETVDNVFIHLSARL
jgi:hypothetical protein